MSWSAANNADVLAPNGQLMCFVQTLCATCQGTLHALQWLWKMYTAKCQTFIKLLDSFHARAELLCGRNKHRENDSCVNVSGGEGGMRNEKRTFADQALSALIVKDWLCFIYLFMKGATNPHRWVISHWSRLTGERPADGVISSQRASP